MTHGIQSNRTDLEFPLYSTGQQQQSVLKIYTVGSVSSWPGFVSLFAFSGTAVLFQFQTSSVTLEVHSSTVMELLIFVVFRMLSYNN